MIKTPVNGMRDILPKEMELRNYVLSLIRETYRSFGFTEMETPAVESIENLTGKQGGENEKLIFKIMKRGEKLNIGDAKTENDLADSGLRYDLTVPLSRYFSNHEAELMKPFKALQIGPVWRADRPQKGRFRQFYQCDIDILGESMNLAEIELILATTTVLSRLGFRKVEIRINDRRLLKAMAAYAGVSEDLYDETFIALDKLDKIGTEGVEKELLALGIAEDGVKKYLDLFRVTAGKTGTEALRAIEEKLGESLDAEVVRNLSEIFDIVNASKTHEFDLVFDPTLVRGMGYYTGPIFEISVPEFGSSVGGGGRYDEMVGKFIGKNTPACGFSIGFERIIVILSENGFSIPGTEGKTAFLLEKGLSAEKKTDALREANALRKDGKVVLVAQMAKNKKFQKEQLLSAGYTEFQEFYEHPFQ